MNFFSSRITRHLAIGVVVISAIVMGYILYDLGKTKNYFATKLIEQSSERTVSELNEFFLPVENMMLALKQQQEIQFLQHFDSVDLNRYFIPIINRYSQISSVGIADSRGYEFNIFPDTTAGNWLNREVFVDEWGMTEKWNRWNINGSISHSGYWERNLKIDPRDRPWFKGAIMEGGKQIHWTEPYLYMTNDELGLTASIKWQSLPNDTLQHILALDVTLQDITRFSQNLSLTKNNQVFILTGENKNIIGLPREYSDYSSKDRIGKLLSTPDEFGNLPLADLLTYPHNQIVSFDREDNNWWGIVKTYPVNTNQELLIAILIPEKDFSSEIDSTRNAMIAGFLVILLLSSLLVANHNKLRRTGHLLNEKNDFITQQKERLFAEVHHRVKNNLAIMAALMDLENMESTNPAVNQVLTQTQKRVKSMSAVHEILYKSDDMNRVQVKEFIPGILNFSKKDFNEQNTEIKLDIDEVYINVNQALTFALLLNEFMNSLLKAELELRGAIEIRVKKVQDRLSAVISIGTDFDYLKMNRDVGKQLIEVLLEQLQAEIEITVEEKFTSYQISFDLKDVKGITSNYNYNKSEFA